MKIIKVVKYIILSLLFLFIFGFSLVFTQVINDDTRIHVGKDIKFSSKTEYITSYESKDGIFYGKLIDGKFSKGEFDFLSNEIYVGSFSDSKLQHGKMIYPQIGYYEGQYKENKRNGTGKFYFINNDVYSGMWNNDCLSNGKYTFENGNYYEGTFSNNKPCEGKLYIKNDDVDIVFTIKKDTDLIYIKMHELDDDYLDGYLDGVYFTGDVHLTYADGSVYQGQMQDSKRNGIGTYSWKTGEFYEGEWEDDRMNGDGDYYYQGIDQYPKLSGAFLNGLPNGTCTYYKDVTSKFITKWDNGKCTKVSE